MPYGNLTPGMEGPEVLELRWVLTALGYGGSGDGLGNPDGKYALSATGVLDAATSQAINSLG